MWKITLKIARYFILLWIECNSKKFAESYKCIQKILQEKIEN